MELYKSFSMLLEIPKLFILYTKLSCQTLSKTFDISKRENSECVSKERQLIIKVSSTIDKSWLTHESDFLNQEHNKRFSSTHL